MIGFAVNVEMDEAMYRALQVEAAAEHIGVAELIRRCITYAKSNAATNPSPFVAARRVAEEGTEK